MSFAFQELSPGSTEHVRVRDRITSILQAYFYGVIYAPCIFLSLGKEIERLRDFIEQVISENNNPNSLIFRGDNKLAAQKAVHLAIRGIHASLNDVESTLRTAKTHRGQTERWWTTFATAIRFNGGDKAFLVALENFRNNTERLAEIAEQNSMHLNELLADLLSASTGVSSMNEAITSRFAEHAKFNGYIFTSGFGVETALGISMYWAFKVITNIKETAISMQLSGEVCLGLFKACWIFQKLREDPRAQQMPEELQTIMVIVSTELSFAAKTLLEINVELPALQTLISCGDFRIFVDSFDDDVEDEVPMDQLPSNLRPQGLSPQISPYLPQQASSEDLKGAPVVMNNTTVHPAAYNTYERGDGDNLSINGIELSSNHWNTGLPTNNDVNQRPAPVTPPTSPPDPQRRASSSQVEGSRNRSNFPLNSSGSMNGRYHNYPTPVLNIVGGGLARSPTLIDSMRYGVPPLDTPHPHEFLPYRGPPTPNKPHGYSQKPLPTLKLSNESPPVNRFGAYNYENTTSSGVPPSGPVSPVTPGMRPEISIMEPQDYGVRPGESEIMKDGFRIMDILASDSCDASSRWDECVIRIFKSSVGDLRILTLREGSVDQRHITLKNAEFIPEYGYHMHENLPVIFIRSAGPGRYSRQSKKRPQRTSLSSVDLPAASLYYRFKALVDLFEFQRAILGERVEAEIQVVRSITYKRSGEHSNHMCRIQLWRENPINPKSTASTRTTSISGNRTRPHTSTLNPRSTRVVMFLGQVIITFFVTDDVTIEEISGSLTLKIKPISSSTFGRSYVKACILGNRELSGGIRLDKEGLLIEDEEKFDDFKWFTIDFQTSEELTLFKDEFNDALNERRRERGEIEEVRRKAAIGLRAN